MSVPRKQLPAACYQLLLETSCVLPLPISMTTMQAIILRDAFKVVLEDVPKPEITDDREVLIEVHYSGLCGTSKLLSSCGGAIAGKTRRV